MTDHLSALREEFTSHLRQLVPPARSVALVDFPNHTNCGDSLIWLGEVHTLRRLGIRIGHVGSRRLEDVSHVGAGDGPVLCHGGGNFGDIDRRSVEVRARVVASCGHRPVIFLPQSLHYASEELRAEDAQALRRHPALTVMVRDEPSLQQAREMGLTAVLTPDAAFGTDAFSTRPSDHAPPGSSRVAAIWRTDKEVNPTAGSVASQSGGVDRADWLPGNSAPHLVVGAMMRATYAVRSPVGDAVAVGATHAVAAYEVQRARRLMSGAGVVATDRLHAAVLALMLGKRVVWVDNSYGKLSAVLGRWVDPSAGWERADDRPSAERRALELAAAVS